LRPWFDKTEPYVSHCLNMIKRPNSAAASAAAVADMSNMSVR